MKVNDIVLKEAPNKGTAAGYKGSAGAQAIAQASGIQDVNKIKVGQVLKIPGQPDYTVKAGDTLDKIAATFKVGSAPAPANVASAPAADKAAPANVASAPAADKAAPAQSDGTTQDIERLKKLAIGGNQTATPAQDAMAGADAGNQTSSGYSAQSQAQKSPEPAEPEAPVNNQSSGYSAQSQAQKSPDVPQASSGYTGGSSTAQAPGGYAQSAVPNTSGQAAQPNTEINPDTGLSTKPGEVKTGTGGTTNLKTSSDDEMAWRSKQTGIVDISKYPGPGNWDPKTGRTKQDPNKPGFFDRLFGKKAAPAAQQGGQGGQAAQTPQESMGNLSQDQINLINKNFGPKEDLEINRIKILSGLK